MDDDDFENFCNFHVLPKKKYNDFETAKNVADFLQITFEPIPIRKSLIFEKMNEIFFACQDWRDFNVHCASLNFFIAMHIKQKKYLSSRLILTGVASAAKTILGQKKYEEWCLYGGPKAKKLMRRRNAGLLKHLERNGIK